MALSAPKRIQTKGNTFQESVRKIPLATGQAPYAGSAMQLDPSDGFAYVAVGTTTGLISLGVMLRVEQPVQVVGNTSPLVTTTADGEHVAVIKPGIHGFVAGGTAVPTAAHIGLTVNYEDDETITNDVGSVAGKLLYVENGVFFVDTRAATEKKV